MRTDLISISNLEPVQLSEAKAHLRVDESFNDDDVYIRMLIKAARERAEAYTGRAFVQKTYNLYLTEYASAVELPNEPISTVDEVKYLNSAGTWVALASLTDYVLAKSNTGVQVILNDISALSTTENVDKIKIKYTCGVYANVAGDSVKNPFPDSVKYAMLLMIRTMYDNRDNIVTGTIVNEIPTNSQFLLNPFRTFKFR